MKVVSYLLVLSMEVIVFLLMSFLFDGWFYFLSCGLLGALLAPLYIRIARFKEGDIGIKKVDKHVLNKKEEK